MSRPSSSLRTVVSDEGVRVSDRGSRLTVVRVLVGRVAAVVARVVRVAWQGQEATSAAGTWASRDEKHMPWLLVPDEVTV